MAVTHMAATTHEKQLTEGAKNNANILKQFGVLVIHNVDATRLDKSLKPYLKNIITH